MKNQPQKCALRIDPEAVRVLDFATLTRANARQRLLALCRGETAPASPQQLDRALMLAAEAALLCARRRARRRDLTHALRQVRRRYGP